MSFPDRENRNSYALLQKPFLVGQGTASFFSRQKLPSASRLNSLRQHSRCAPFGWSLRLEEGSKSASGELLALEGPDSNLPPACISKR